MDSDRPIPAPAKSLGNIIKKGAAGIRAELIGAAPIHNMFGAAGQTSDPVQMERLEQRITGKAPVHTERLTRGDDVIDVEKRRKGTIISTLKSASADGQRRFQIVDSKGNAWTQKEGSLRKK